MDLFSNSFSSFHFHRHASCENLAHALKLKILSEGRERLSLTKLLPLLGVPSFWTHGSQFLCTSVHNDLLPACNFISEKDPILKERVRFSLSVSEGQQWGVWRGEYEH